jgi:diaminobutyrate-2-oxoglutarate transaminase
MSIFQETESNVMVYARSFPVTFTRASGEFLFDQQGEKYLDFLAGAGSLNYGHNNPVLKTALLNYIESDGITHGLDMHTEAKARFLETFRCNILLPRNMDYRLQFTGPTGTNAVEAALKLARKVKQRQNIVAFTNGFHGVSLGAVAATGNRLHRGGAGVALANVTRMPYCGYYGQEVDTLKIFEQQLNDPSSGLDKPAAVIVEVIQGEGGLNIAKDAWLRGLEKICRKFDILLIVDDIQAGCGRSGQFFSFERSGIKPDMVTLSKSLSGFGLPMAVVLLAPELDQWAPGEHNGTFRGNNHAFITAAAALENYWSNDEFSRSVEHKANLISKTLKSIADRHGNTQLRPKGRGFMQGLACASGDIAAQISREAFSRNLIIETSGNRSQVVKCLCPLTIAEDHLQDGLCRLAESVDAVLKSPVSAAS